LKIPARWLEWAGWSWSYCTWHYLDASLWDLPRCWNKSSDVTLKQGQNTVLIGCFTKSKLAIETNIQVLVLLKII